MSNIIRRTTEFAMHIVSAYIEPGDWVIDATCGNGHDTLALAGLDPGRLFAFDIQADAVRETTDLLVRSGYGESLAEGRFTVTQLAHEDLSGYFASLAGSDSPGEPARSSIKAAVFNLGYLPGGDKTLTTKAGTTLAAVRGVMDLLQPDGLICITMYNGHPEGQKEKAALLDFADGLDSKTWHCAYISMPNQKHDPPEILLITRKG